MLDFLDPIIIVTAAFILGDIITGIAKGIYLKSVNSTALKHGAWSKSGFFGLIVLAYMLQWAALHFDFGFEVPAVSAICLYIILTEAVSIFENLCIINPKLVESPLGSLFLHDSTIEKKEDQ